VWGSRGIVPLILVLGIRWRLVVSFTPRPIYPMEKDPDTHLIGSTDMFTIKGTVLERVKWLEDIKYTLQN
jgi:hypothetical protein